jgi:hypothetical protein
VNGSHARDDEWQRVWIHIRQHGWTSLAIVPSHAGIDSNTVAETLAATGRLQGERPIDVVDGRRVQLENAHALGDAVTAAVNSGTWVVLSVDPIIDSPAAIALVQGTSAAVLVIRLGESLLGSAQSTLDAIGRDRFIGSIVLDEEMKPVLG